MDCIFDEIMLGTLFPPDKRGGNNRKYETYEL